MEEFDEHFPDGVFAMPSDPNAPRIKVRALHQYCKEKGVTPKDLTKEEMNQFIVKRKE